MWNPFNRLCSRRLLRIPQLDNFCFGTLLLPATERAVEPASSFTLTTPTSHISRLPWNPELHFYNSLFFGYVLIGNLVILFSILVTSLLGRAAELKQFWPTPRALLIKINHSLHSLILFTVHHHFFRIGLRGHC